MRLGSIIILANRCDFTRLFCVVVSIYSIDSAVAAAPEEVSDSAFPVPASEAAEVGINHNIGQPL